MRFRCYGCNKFVSSEVPDDAILRAVTWCPECVESGKDQDEEQRCLKCEKPTGHSAEQAIYKDGKGPLCHDCAESTVIFSAVIEDDECKCLHLCDVHCPDPPMDDEERERIRGQQRTYLLGPEFPTDGAGDGEDVPEGDES